MLTTVSAVENVYENLKVSGYVREKLILTVKLLNQDYQQDFFHLKKYEL